MKKFLTILASFGAGYFFNTETGKRLRNWSYSKVQEQINNFVGKVNEVTSDSPSPTPEEGK